MRQEKAQTEASNRKVLALSGCTSVGRFGVIQVRLPAETRGGFVDIKLVDVESPRAVALIETIFREHGLAPCDPSQPYQDPGIMMPLQAWGRRARPASAPSDY